MKSHIKLSLILVSFLGMFSFIICLLYASLTFFLMFILCSFGCCILSNLSDTNNKSLSNEIKKRRDELSEKIKDLTGDVINKDHFEIKALIVAGEKTSGMTVRSKSENSNDNDNENRGLNET